MSTPQVVLSTENGKSITALALSNDAKTLVSGGTDRRVRFWDVETKDCDTHAAHGWSIADVCLSPDGATVASISRGLRGEAKYRADAVLWNLRSRKTIKLPTERYLLHDPVFLDAGRIVAFKNGDIVLYDVKTGARCGSIPEAEPGILAGSPNGRQLVFGDADGTLRVWDAKRKSLIHEWTAHQSRFTPVAFSDKGGQLGTYGLDGTFCVWSMQDYERLITADINVACPAAVGCCSELQAWVFIGSDGYVTLVGWDAVVHDEIKLCPWSITAASFSPDGATVALGTGDGEVTIWNVADIVSRRSPPGPAQRPDATHCVEPRSMTEPRASSANSSPTPESVQSPGIVKGQMGRWPRPSLLRYTPTTSWTTSWPRTWH